MSLLNTSNVDITVKSPHFDGYDLIAIDSGDIVDQVERYNKMIEKLTNYMEYVVSGQVYDQTPDAKGKEIRFCVLCAVPPNEAMLNVEGLKTRNEPTHRFSVLVTNQESYVGCA